jgi:hypothetical protein
MNIEQPLDASGQIETHNVNADAHGNLLASSLVDQPYRNVLSPLAGAGPDAKYIKAPMR